MAKGNRRARPSTGPRGFSVDFLHVSATCRPCADRGRPLVVRSRWAINAASTPPGLPLGPPRCPQCGNRRFWSLVYGTRPDWADLYRRARRGEDVSHVSVPTEERLEALALEGLPDVEPEKRPEVSQDGEEGQGEEGQQ